jgi:hypothetical protein
MYFAICNEVTLLFQAVKSVTAAKKDDSCEALIPRNGWEGVFLPELPEPAELDPRTG